ncbi:MAG: glycosyltransferase [Verrucomicrobia bacterium]|nr:glycosyltransferase [Verrucomicrobiota bacterium]
MLSIVIPAYNEEHRLPGNLPLLLAHLDAMRLAEGFEVIVVVEKSTDRTVEACRAAVSGRSEVQIVANEVKRGKGYAVRCGMLRAAGEFVFFMDADLSTPLASIEAFCAHFAAHPEHQVLIGNRRHPKSVIGVRQGFLRRKLSDAFNLVVQALILPGCADTQCGFKAFRRGAAQAIFSRQKLDGFSFDLEILLLARRLGLGIQDLPVDWCDEPASTLRPLRDGAKMLADIFKVRALVHRTLAEQPASAAPVPR